MKRLQHEKNVQLERTATLIQCNTEKVKQHETARKKIKQERIAILNMNMKIMQ